MKSSCIIPTMKFLTRYAHAPNPIKTIVITGSAMWYNNAKIYPGSSGSILGVALAGKKFGIRNANTNIINIPIHQTGKTTTNYCKC